MQMLCSIFGVLNSNLALRPCKIQCIFYCHRVVKSIAQLFVYVGPQPFSSKRPQQTQLNNSSFVVFTKKI